MLRYLTAGESHGQALVVIVEGLPAGLPITVEDIQIELSRRRLGYGRGPRQRFEQDEVTLVGGVRHGRTLGRSHRHDPGIRQCRIADGGSQRQPGSLRRRRLPADLYAVIRHGACANLGRTQRQGGSRPPLEQ